MQRSVKTLIVGKDDFLNGSLKDKLQKMKLDVLDPVYSAEEALAVYMESFPDLVIMEIPLAGPLNGISTAKLIHTKNKIPIIFITESIDHLNTAEILETDLLFVLLKPFKNNEIKAVVLQALKKMSIQCIGKINHNN